MENKNITAVEWLIEQYNLYRPGQMPKSKFKEVCEKAKAMEIKQTQDYGEFCVNCDRNGMKLLAFEDCIKLFKNE